MAVETRSATRRGSKVVAGKGDGSSVKYLGATVEAGSADSVNSTYSFGQIPSNARVLGISKLYTDDLASTGSPVLDLGLFAVNGNITSDDDALRASIDVFTAAAVNNITADVANYGKAAWEFVSGQTSDPGGVLEVKATLKTAALNVGGTIALELYYELD